MADLANCHLIRLTTKASLVQCQLIRHGWLSTMSTDSTWPTRQNANWSNMADLTECQLIQHGWLCIMPTDPTILLLTDAKGKQHVSNLQLNTLYIQSRTVITRSKRVKVNADGMIIFGPTCLSYSWIRFSSMSSTGYRFFRSSCCCWYSRL